MNDPTTRDLINETPLPENVRSRFLSVLDDTGFLPNDPPPQGDARWPTWASMASSLNAAVLNQDAIGYLMSDPDARESFHLVEDWSVALGPLLYSVEPFGKWNIDPPHTTAAGALEIAQTLHKSAKWCRRVALASTPKGEE